MASLEELNALAAHMEWADAHVWATALQSTAARSDERLRGWLQPPTDGKYTFWLAGDAEAELWLSTNALPVFSKRISVVTEATRPGEWNRVGEQQSDPVSLKGGQTYYIEARQRQGNAPGFLAVAWRGPNWLTRWIMK